MSAESLPLNERLLRLRLHTGLSQPALARRLAGPPWNLKGGSSWQYYETSYKRPSVPIEKALALAKAVKDMGDPPLTEADVLRACGLSPRMHGLADDSVAAPAGPVHADLEAGFAELMAGLQSVHSEERVPIPIQELARLSFSIFEEIRQVAYTADEMSAQIRFALHQHRRHLRRNRAEILSRLPKA